MTDNIAEIRYLSNLKKENKEEYDVFLKEYKEVLTDIAKIGMEVVEEIEYE